MATADVQPLRAVVNEAAQRFEPKPLRSSPVNRAGGHFVAPDVKAWPSCVIVRSAPLDRKHYGRTAAVGSSEAVGGVFLQPRPELLESLAYFTLSRAEFLVG